ncbi:hypothetical protein AVEN_117019-1 [Araneus ventricosus]|uniref:Uncharacterized protein n=1 Tax=Araneus ventricosus TaxID=182803 RepID=A0A4Y2RYA3_ARAVE|nr:hypothetical protein AVEN_200215-1 [Araneus ventricosus]GBN80007.1 hypothetical protein AVEN_117019-1 [Araneus ventricosus]
MIQGEREIESRFQLIFLYFNKCDDSKVHIISQSSIVLKWKQLRPCNFCRTLERVQGQYLPSVITQRVSALRVKTKGTSPRPPKHPGKQLEDRPPATDRQTLWFLHNSPHYERLFNNPAFYRGTTCHRKWARRVTPPLLCHRVDESLLTYTAASHPRTRDCCA